MGARIISVVRGLLKPLISDPASAITLVIMLLLILVIGVI